MEAQSLGETQHDGDKDAGSGHVGGELCCEADSQGGQDWKRPFGKDSDVSRAARHRLPGGRRTRGSEWGKACVQFLPLDRRSETDPWQMLRPVWMQ